MTTYSLAEVARILCGDDLVDPELWVKRRIRAGQFRALKVGRTFRMTQQQLDDALASLEVGAVTPSPQVSTLTPRALRRRRTL